METSKTTTDNPRIFLTDYASYNNGTQFEFGHWVDLTDFANADDLAEYITKHFEEADEKSPLDSPREEIMITDFENLPRGLYSESGMNFEKVYEFINLDDNDKAKVAFILEQGESIDYALSKYEDVYLYEDTDATLYDLFETFYPDAVKAEETCYYLDINYERFRKENFTEFEYNGESYIVEDNWNN